MAPGLEDFPRGFRVPTYRSSGLPHDSHTRLQSVPYTPQFRPSKKNCLEYVSSSARARLRVDKVESSNPNLKAAHAGAGGRAQGETQHLQLRCCRCRRCRVGLFCPFQARFPHSGTLWTSRGKARFASQNSQFLKSQRRESQTQRAGIRLYAPRLAACTHRDATLVRT